MVGRVVVYESIRWVEEWGRRRGFESGEDGAGRRRWEGWGRGEHWRVVR